MKYIKDMLSKENLLWTAVFAMSLLFVFSLFFLVPVVLTVLTAIMVLMYLTWVIIFTPAEYTPDAVAGIENTIMHFPYEIFVVCAVNILLYLMMKFFTVQLQKHCPVRKTQQIAQGVF